MRTLRIVISILTLLSFAACKKNAQQNDRNIRAGILPDGSTLPLIIDTQVELVINGTYYLDGRCFVKSGGELKINPGVTVKCITKLSPAETSALISSACI